MDVSMDDQDWMRLALREAEAAASIREVPVGAIVVSDGEVIARAHNLRESEQDPVAHAEILALQQAARHRSSWRLGGCSLYVTLEPCAMCAGALVNSRVDRVVFGAFDPKAGFCGSLGNLLADERLNHRVEVVTGVLAEESTVLLKGFFAQLRDAGS
jgi:tRNA(adenine34) deaminase